MATNPTDPRAIIAQLYAAQEAEQARIEQARNRLVDIIERKYRTEKERDAHMTKTDLAQLLGIDPKKAAYCSTDACESLREAGYTLPGDLQWPIIPSNYRFNQQAPNLPLEKMTTNDFGEIPVIPGDILQWISTAPPLQGSREYRRRPYHMTLAGRDGYEYYSPGGRDEYERDKIIPEDVHDYRYNVWRYVGELPRINKELEQAIANAKLGPKEEPVAPLPMLQPKPMQQQYGYKPVFAPKFQSDKVAKYQTGTQPGRALTEQERRNWQDALVDWVRTQYNGDFKAAASDLRVNPWKSPYADQALAVLDWAQTVGSGKITPNDHPLAGLVAQGIEPVMGMMAGEGIDDLARAAASVGSGIGLRASKAAGNTPGAMLPDAKEWSIRWHSHPEFLDRYMANMDVEDLYNIFGPNNYIDVYKTAKFLSKKAQDDILTNIDNTEIKNYHDLLKDLGFKGLGRYLSSYGLSYGHPKGIYVRNTELPLTPPWFSSIFSGFKGWRTPDARNATGVHEVGGHLSDLNQFRLSINPKTLEELKKPLITEPRKGIINAKKWFDYYTMPTEVRARMQQARHRFNLDPSDKFTSEMYDQVMKENDWFGMGKYIKDKDGFIKLMNTMWGAAPAAIVGGAAAVDEKKKGGVPKYQNGTVNNDSLLENILEFIDFTGYLSHDDARAAYNAWQQSGNTLPSFGESLDMFGAVPALGKFGKIKYLADIPDAIKPVYKFFPWQKALNAGDTSQDIVMDSKSKKRSSPKKKQNGTEPAEKPLGPYTLPEMTVVGANTRAGEGTLAMLNNMAKSYELTRDEMENMLRLWAQYGTPYIHPIPKPNYKDTYRAFYTADPEYARIFTQPRYTVGGTKEPAEDKFDQYAVAHQRDLVAELAHAKQFVEQYKSDVEAFNAAVKRDIQKNIDAGYGPDEAQLQTYDQPNTLENQAHYIIEPSLWDYIFSPSIGPTVKLDYLPYHQYRLPRKEANGGVPKYQDGTLPEEMPGNWLPQMTVVAPRDMRGRQTLSLLDNPYAGIDQTLLDYADDNTPEAFDRYSNLLRLWEMSGYPQIGFKTPEDLERVKQGEASNRSHYKQSAFHGDKAGVYLAPFDKDDPYNSYYVHPMDEIYGNPYYKQLFQKSLDLGLHMLQPGNYSAEKAAELAAMQAEIAKYLQESKNTQNYTPTIIAEFTHALQDKQGEMGRLNNLIDDLIIAPTDGTPADYDKIKYDTPGSIEYDAHKVKQPLMEKYYAGPSMGPTVKLDLGGEERPVPEEQRNGGVPKYQVGKTPDNKESIIAQTSWHTPETLGLRTPKIWGEDEAAARSQELKDYYDNTLIPYYINEGYGAQEAKDEASKYLYANHPEDYFMLFPNAQTSQEIGPLQSIYGPMVAPYLPSTEIASGLQYYDFIDNFTDAFGNLSLKQSLSFPSRVIDAAKKLNEPNLITDLFKLYTTGKSQYGYLVPTTTPEGRPAFGMSPRAVYDFIDDYTPLFVPGIAGADDQYSRALGWKARPDNPNIFETSGTSGAFGNYTLGYDKDRNTYYYRDIYDLDKIPLVDRVFQPFEIYGELPNLHASWLPDVTVTAKRTK